MRWERGVFALTICAEVEVEQQFPVVTLLKQWDFLFHSACVDMVAYIASELRLGIWPLQTLLEHGLASVPEGADVLV